uniref:Uncharacterized protein n=1 Tax=Avena sativa TaxID=4498 RepID=A0ACD5YMS6_AVESA
MSEDLIRIEMHAAGEYLLIFDNISDRNAAVQWQGAVSVGSAKFILSPWSRFRGASAGRLNYRARICLEGVPRSAHQVEAVRSLFGANDIIDCVDDIICSKEESGCFRLWVWMGDVAALARRGRLDLEEPLEVDSPLMHYPELGIEADPPIRAGPIKTLSYDIILHLDRVTDFSGSPASSPGSNVSYHSDVSGLPSDTSMTQAFPTNWAYRWFLGYEAGTFPPPSRAPVHSRIRFPDGHGRNGGGGSGGGGAGGGRRDEGTEGGRSSRPGGRMEWRRSQPQPPATGDHRGSDASGYHHQLAELVGAAAGSLVVSPAREPMAELQPLVPAVMACMPNLMDSVPVLGQTGPTRESPKRKEADGLEDDTRLLHGLAEQGSHAWGALPEDGDAAAGTGTQKQVLWDAEEDNAATRDEPIDVLLYGPHSPRAQVSPTLIGPLGEGECSGLHGSDVIVPYVGADGPVVGQGTDDPLQCFLLEHSKPKDSPLLPPPVHSAAGDDRQDHRKIKSTTLGKRSDRLAAKRTAGCSTMEKVNLVLLKKSGLLPEEATPQPADLQRIQKIYNKPLPSSYIAAVTALVEAGSSGKFMAAAGLGLLAA